MNAKTVTVGQIRTTLEKMINPMIWKRVQLRILHRLNEKGLFLHTMTDDKVLDYELVLRINEALEDLCGEQLPPEILKK